MNRSAKELIPAVVSYVVDQGGFVTKTKLLKLLYLFDVEYYRRHRQTFTGFSWKYFHLGPWAKEFDPLLGELVDAGVLNQTSSPRSDYDTKFFKTTEYHDVDRVLGDLKDTGTLRRVLDLWFDSTTGEILDYVYFRTEPMETAVRNEPLDFSIVRETPVETYRRSSSGKSPHEIQLLRREFRQSMEQRTAKQASTFAFTPPRYDEEFFEALEKLETVRL